jgi:hypothetical protein
MFSYIWHLFASFLFSNYLEDGEKILYVAHKHIWTHYKTILKRIFFGFFMPSIIYLIFPPALYIMIGWTIIGALTLIYELIDWYFDALLITNLSLLNVKWDGFLNSSSTRVEYSMIEGVSYTKKGFAQTILGYGDLSVEKIGSGNLFTLTNCVNPKKVEREIMKQQNLIVEENTIKNHNTLKELISNMVHRHQSPK